METTTTKQVYRVGVQGMDCRACEQLLVKHVQRVPGVDTSFADADAGTLTILVEDSASVAAIVSSIIESGFVPVAAAGVPALIPVVELLDPAPRELTLSAVGMHCGACEMLVTMAALKVPGVTAATGDATAQTVTVTVDGPVDLDELASAVISAGFQPGNPFVVDAPAADACPVIPAALAETPEPASPAAVEPVVSAPVSAPAAAPAPSVAEATFAVTGMTCASCSSVIEKVLGSTPGVSSAVVNLATEKLSVTYDPAVIDVDGIVATVKSAGYGALPLGAPAPAAASTGRVTLGIIGMTCASCATVIEKTMAAVPGVTTATVNLAANSSSIEFDPAIVGFDELIKAVRGAGYDAVVKVDKIPGAQAGTDVQAEARAKALKHEQFLFIFSLAFAVPAFLIRLTTPTPTS